MRVNKLKRNCGRLNNRGMGVRRRVMELSDKVAYYHDYDSVTGLFNRRYFEEQMGLLEAEARPCGIMVCEVQGLALVRVLLGQGSREGLLAEVGRFLREALRTQDIAAYVGDNVFYLLLPELSDDEAKDLRKKIKDDSIRRKVGFPLELSVGFCNDTKGDKPYIDLLQQADELMYRDKLYNSRNKVSEIVQSLKKTLWKRDFMDEERSIALQDLMRSLAVAAGLAESRVKDVCLLAEFHDIGNVMVPDEILYKDLALEEEEAEIMRRHCENGHRIAHSISYLAPISDYLLKHHECWDGSGYPWGLKGEDIPLECRILAIADAYLAMISVRPYREALTKNEALNELQRCAGSQFDPALATMFIKMIGEEG